MRLICGFFHLDGRPAAPARLEAMIAAMIEPGLTPRIARRIDGPVALSVLDFTGGPACALPQGESGLVVAADVVLHEPGAGVDDARLLATLERRGAAGVGALLGDFVFAAWDPQSRTLLCGRDAMGIRPLFFAHRPGAVFVFASLPRGLHASGLVERVLDEAYLLGDLLGRLYGPERSLFRGVERLAPGGLARVSARGIDRDRHWRLDPAPAGRRVCRPEDAAEELTALVRDAVRCRLPPAGPVAAHLSGGLDSTSLAILAARALRDQGRSLLGYSLMPVSVGDFAPDGERLGVEAALRQEPDIVWTPIRNQDPTALVLPRMDPDQVMPGDPADSEMKICADAAGRGAGVVLSGWGGDEGASNAGAGALAEALLAGHWRILAHEVRALAAADGSPAGQVLRRRVLLRLLPEPMQRQIQDLMLFIRGKPSPRRISDAVAFLRHDAVAGVTPRNHVMKPNDVTNRWERLTGPGLPRRTENWALTAARHGLAAAFPLLDRRVVAFALSLPGALFLRDGWPRRLYRDAMTGILPAEIRESRQKLMPHPELPVMVMTQRDEMLRRLPGMRAHPRVTGLFDLDALERRLRALPEPEDTLRRAASLSADPASLDALLLYRVIQRALYVQQHH